MTRVLQILHGWPAVDQGGTGMYVDALARALVDLGHPVACLAPVPDPSTARPHLLPAEAPPGVAAWTLRLPPPRSFEQTWRRPAADALLAGFLARWRPDVVHVHHLAHASLGWLRVARASAARVVLTLHDYALPCARGQLVDAWARACPGPQPERCASCVAGHLRLSPLTTAISRLLRALPATTRRVQELAGTRPPPGGALRLADRLAAVDHALAQPHRLLSPSVDLAERFADLGLRRPEHLSLPLVRPVAPAPAAAPGPLRLLFASTVIPTKGPHRLVEAFAALPEGAATLTIAGPTPPFDGWPGYGDVLRARVEALGGARWRGAVPPDEVPALLAAHDVLVLPSTWPENSPLVVREATAAGLRTVVPAAGGASELDPIARRIGTGPDALLEALREELATGRGRRAPLAWPTPRSHALTLLADAYRPPAGPGR